MSHCDMVDTMDVSGEIKSYLTSDAGKTHIRELVVMHIATHPEDVAAFKELYRVKPVKGNPWSYVNWFFRGNMGTPKTDMLLRKALTGAICLYLIAGVAMRYPFGDEFYYVADTTSVIGIIVRMIGLPLSDSLPTLS